MNIMVDNCGRMIVMIGQKRAWGEGFECYNAFLNFFCGNVNHELCTELQILDSIHLVLVR